MPDADMDMAANAIMGAAFGAAGERCMALSVVVAVGDEVADTLVEKLRQQIVQMSVGPGINREIGITNGKENDMGPVISQQHRAKIYDYICSGVEQGAKLLVDGREYQVAGHENGYFVGPTLFDYVTPEMKIYKEEIFGPVLAIVRVPDYDTALNLINQHEYGNGAAIFTCDGETARQCAFGTSR
ncbi:aldehyde dehydrogenase [Xenorhabdus thuongxuanensis]|uniref:methylmalonate-semialdehyde dehydrogenase (CoA acylating) n=1 Tax=Xenorhabdus thuongxuanensis TaxID=1873484 RepID=A0A1Q5U5V0_9GAMM|nr:aldehyde dehydrogenase [Xenorhabdus thuongxuanensis]